MKSLFRLDSPIMQKLSLLGSLMIAGFFWLICSLPVITIGASTSAMYRVVFDLRAERNGRVFDFFRYFAIEFKKSTVLWGIFMLAAVLLYAQFLILAMPNISGAMHFALQIMFYLALIIWLFALQYSLALTAYFENTILSTLKNALLMSFLHPIRSLFCTALTIAPLVLFFTSVSLFFKLSAVLIMLYPGLSFYWKGEQLSVVFKKYISQNVNEKHMKKPTLVIMAAGMGSRFGGLKQIAPVDEQGHIIIDFSLFDAWRSGFRDLVFIIKPEMEDAFREAIGSRMEKYFNITYIYQTIDKLPQGYSVPYGREKPWGTGHAVLCCKDVVDGPFAVINADDFYGPTAFSTMYDYLENNTDESQYAMVGYRVRNTVTENGSVARGVCQVENDLLTSVTERTKIFKNGADVKFTEDGETFVNLPGDTIVSMNFWGFTPKMFRELDVRFASFLDEAIASNPLKGEYFLPSVVNDQLQEGIASVRVFPCEETWYGVTYREDLASVKAAIADMKKRGIYEENLWNE